MARKLSKQTKSGKQEPKRVKKEKPVVPTFKILTLPQDQLASVGKENNVELVMPVSFKGHPSLPDDEYFMRVTEVNRKLPDGTIPLTLNVIRCLSCSSNGNLDKNEECDRYTCPAGTALKLSVR